MRSSDFLSSTFGAWRVKPPPDPEFRAEVWRRIGEAREAAPWTAFVRARVAVLATAATLTIAVSGWAGHSLARIRAEADRDALAASYIAALDARVHLKLDE